jgi:hypothetical protein
MRPAACQRPGREIGPQLESLSDSASLSRGSGSSGRPGGSEPVAESDSGGSDRVGFGLGHRAGPGYRFAGHGAEPAPGPEAGWAPRRHLSLRAAEAGRECIFRPSHAVTPGHAESRDCDRHGDRGDATVAAGIEPSRDLENSVPRPGSGPAAGQSRGSRPRGSGQLALEAARDWHCGTQAGRNGDRH